MNNDDLNRGEEQAMDALLSEILGGTVPPDLSQPILVRHSAANPSVVVDVHDPGRNSRKGSVVKPLVTAVSIVTALAASILLLIWLQGTAVDPSNERGAMVAVSEPDSTGDVAVDSLAATAANKNETGNQPARSPQVPQGIPLLVGDGGKPPSDPRGESPEAIQVPKPKRDAEAIVLVAKRVDTDLVGYWKSIGIQPTADATLPETVARLTGRLGAEIIPEAMLDPELLRAELSDPATSRQIAKRWLTVVTGGGLSRMEDAQREGLIGEVAEAFQAKRRLDVTLARWLGGDHPRSSDWYAALSTSGPDVMLHRIASLSMNVDLRCTRCHDALIEGSGRQDDYWSFAAFVRQSVHRDRDGQWRIDGGKDSGKPFFYELPDGRQRMVQAGIPPAWMGPLDDRPIEDVRQWSRRIVGSPELARGVVNSFWKLIHGRRLREGVVDTMTAPHSESLSQIETLLVDDLLNSGFDVSRSLALIIHSPATRRSVPTVLEPNHALLASDSELRAAKEIVGAFGGALPLQAKPSIKRRIDLAMRSAGGSIRSIRQTNTINAQADGSPGDNAPSRKPQAEDDAGGFPIAAGDFPVQWLASVKGFENRVEHLGYLAGLNRMPSEIAEAADAMNNSADISEQLALHRVWWLLSP